jgi:hypothetical protein
LEKGRFVKFVKLVQVLQTLQGAIQIYQSDHFTIAFRCTRQAQRRQCISAIKSATKGAVKGATKGAKIAQAQNRLEAQNPQLLRVLRAM